MYYFKLEDLKNDFVIENKLLKGGNLKEEIKIPEGVEVVLGYNKNDDNSTEKYTCCIFYNDFNQNDVLKTIYFPKTAKIVGEKAFEHCHKLTDVYFNEGIEEIKCYAFMGCYKLKVVFLPNSIKSLGTYCFDLIDNLIVHYDGTIEQFNKIKKDELWCKKGTLIKCSDGHMFIE